MPARYAALPNPRSHPDEDELEAAFEASDDEDDRNDHDSESLPLNPGHTGGDRENDHHDNASAHPLATTVPLAHSRSQSIPAPGTYKFEDVDYDYPPPGSPPPNSLGNSNGIIPTSPVLPPRRPGQGGSWVRRVLPVRVADRLVGSERRPRIVAGRGVDGVFANVTAKPTAPRQISEEDSIYVQPEDAQKDAPPTYAAAQADAVPPYWETTVHAPSSLSPGMMIPGELPIEGLATGTVFSFLWNMLVSISFQFVGFLLTYLLHTTHAAKLGARAGLGLTLVQYGFAIKSGRDEIGNADISWGANADNAPDPRPEFSSSAEADAWYATHPNTTMDGMMDGNSDMMGNGTLFASDSTSEWLAFLLMTIGWFVLLNSLLGFWRIKRWERSILASHEEHPERTPQIPANPGHARQSSFARHFERTLGLRLPSFNLSLGLANQGHVGGDQQLLFDYDENFNAIGGRDIERGSIDDDGEGPRRTIEEEIMAAIPSDHPERERLVAEAIANERRLQEDLRAAGLL